MVGISLGVAAVSFFFGFLVRSFFGVDICIRKTTRKEEYYGS